MLYSSARPPTPCRNPARTEFPAQRPLRSQHPDASPRAALFPLKAWQQLCVGTPKADETLPPRDSTPYCEHSHSGPWSESELP